MALPEHPQPQIQAAIEYLLLRGWSPERGPTKHMWCSLVCEYKKNHCEKSINAWYPLPDDHVEAIRGFHVEHLRLGRE